MSTNKERQMNSEEREKLTGEILGLHSQIDECGRKSVPWAVECGRKLKEVKMSFKGLQGKWGDWKCGVTTNGLSDSTITRYIRLYEFSLKEENRSVLTEKSLYEIYEIMRGGRNHSGGNGTSKSNRSANITAR